MMKLENWEVKTLSQGHRAFLTGRAEKGTQPSPTPKLAFFPLATLGTFKTASPKLYLIIYPRPHQRQAEGWALKILPTFAKAQKTRSKTSFIIPVIQDKVPFPEDETMGHAHLSLLFWVDF